MPQSAQRGGGGQYRAAHGCKVNSNRVFCFAFVSFFFFLCIKCPPYRQGTRYTRHSVAGVQKGLPWRLLKQRQQQQPHCTLLPACLHFLFGFHGSSRWAAPLPWQASLSVFSLEVIVAAAAALLHISCQAVLVPRLPGKVKCRASRFGAGISCWWPGDNMQCQRGAWGR